jgi:hypothetical protein
MGGVLLVAPLILKKALRVVGEGHQGVSLRSSHCHSASYQPVLTLVPRVPILVHTPAAGLRRFQGSGGEAEVIHIHWYSLSAHICDPRFQSPSTGHAHHKGVVYRPVSDSSPPSDRNSK